jgi:hypothetical protein
MMPSLFFWRWHEDPDAFARRIDMLDAAGEIHEHLASVE